MFDAPLKVKTAFIPFIVYLLSGLIYLLIFDGGLKSLGFKEVICLGSMAAPFLLIYATYKIFEKSQKGKPPKETVQKLGLDD